MIRAFRVSVVLLVILLSDGASVIRAHESTQNPHILYVNSYHPGNEWSDAIERAIRDRLREHIPGVELSIEYLDSRRFPVRAEERYHAQFEKYRGYQFDLVMVSDNAGFDFLKANRYRYFGDVPVVFCGYNNLRMDVLADMRNITGVNEEADLAGCVRLAFAVHRDLDELVFLLSTGEASSRRNTEIAEREIIPELQQQYKITIIKDRTLAEVEAALQSIPGAAAVIMLGQVTDAGRGRELGGKENAALVSSVSPFPVYVLWDYQLGTGVLGGRVSTGADQGRMAADIAVRILRGERADGIAPVLESPSRNVFDYRALQRFDVSERELPAGSIIINRPRSLFRSYAWQISIGIAVVIIETLLLLALIRNARQRRHALAALQHERDRLETIVAERTGRLRETLAERDRILSNTLVVMALIRNRSFEWINAHVEQLLGYAPEELMGHSTRVIYPSEEDFAAFQEAVYPALMVGRTYAGEQRYRHKNGSIIHCQVSASVLVPDMPERGIIFVVADISERIRKEELVRQLLAEKDLLIREVHHRIKNNMATVRSLLTIQASMQEDEATVRALKDAAGRITSMSVLYDRLYRSSEVTSFSIREYLTSLAEEVLRNVPAAVPVRLETDIEDFMVSPARLSTLGIIVNELITNAQKYAFAGQTEGAIIITVRRQGDSCSVAVADSGCGLSAERPKGFGLQLVELLAGQLGGRMEISAGGESGTRCAITFPADEPTDR